MLDAYKETNDQDYIKLKKEIIKQCGENFNKENAILADYRMHLLRFISDKDPVKRLQKEKGLLFTAEIQHDYWLHYQICDEVSNYIEFWKKDKLELENDIICINRMEKSPNLNKSINDRILCFLEKKLTILMEVYEKWIEDFLMCISKSGFWEKKKFLGYLENPNTPVRYNPLEPYRKYKMYTQYFDILSEIYNFCGNEVLKNKLGYYIKYSKYACVILVKERYTEIMIGKRADYYTGEREDLPFH